MKTILLLLFCLLPGAAISAPDDTGLSFYKCMVPAAAVVACSAVNSFDNNNDSTNNPIKAQVWVAGYYGAGTQGGGLFQYTREPTMVGSTPTCGGDVDDQGITIIAQQHCYRRIFSGAVHLSWYGITNGLPKTGKNFVANSDYCLDPNTRAMCDASPLVSAAFTAASESGNGKVTSDGVPFVWAPGTPGPLEIKQNQSLDCGMPPGSFQQQSLPHQTYYTDPNFIILDPQDTIKVDAAAEISNCSILPIWYTSTSGPAYTEFVDLVGASRKFSGTALSVSDEGALAHDLFIVGFDVCAEVSGSPRAHLYNARGDCNVGVWSNNQKGGFELDHFVSKEFFFEQYNNSTTNTKISPYLTNVTGITGTATATTGLMKITYDATNDNIRANDIVLVQGFNLTNITLTASGTIPTSTVTVPNQTIQGVTPDSLFNSAIIGAAITDTGSCIPSGTIVTDFDPDEDTITLSANTCTAGSANDTVTLKINNVSPAAANGRWIISCAHTPPTACGGTAVLTGSNMAGPSLSASPGPGVTWLQGRQFMSVIDTTDIAPGQFACASGTGPFCMPGTGWTVGTATLSGPLNPTDTGTLTLKTGTTAGWPSFGYIEIGAEVICYDQIKSSTTINVSFRSCDATSVAGVVHPDGAPIKVAAPQVIGVSAKNNVVLLNATASSTPPTSQAMTFSNDLAHMAAGSIGSVSVNPGYKTWTATQNVGGTPDAILTTIPSAYALGPPVTATVANAWKVQPGMKVTNIDVNPQVSATVNAVDPASGVVTLSADVSFAGSNRLQFSGCGYPGIGTSSPQPWLGNCAATAYFFGDIAGPTSNTQGGMISVLSDHGHRRGFASSDWQDGHISQISLGNGGAGGAQLDPTSYGVSFEDSARVNMNDLSTQGASNSLYDNSAVKSDGIGIVNPIFATSKVGGMTIQTGPGSNTALSIAEAKGTTSGLAYFSQNQLRASLEGNVLPNVQLFFGALGQQDAVATTFGCGNVFASGPECSPGGQKPNVTGVLPANITGNDSAGRIILPSSSTTIVMTFANATFPNPPVCVATDERLPVNPIYVTSVSTSSVTFTSTSAMSSGDQISYTCSHFR